MRLRTMMVLLAVVAASPEIRYFRYERPLNLEPVAGPQQTCAVLDAGLFAHAGEGLADMRLYRTGNGSATETPYAKRESASGEAGQKKIEALNLGSRQGQTAFDAEMPEGKYSDVGLDVTGQNFIATVQVTGSQGESTAGETRLGTYTIFDLTDQKLGRSTVLHLPASDFRYLHFVIAGTVSPKQIDGLTVERAPESKTEYVTVAETAQVTQKGRQTEVRFTTPAHVPVDRIAFMPAAEPANFSRDVTVKVTPVPVQTPVSEDEIPQAVESSGDLLRVHGVHEGRRIDEEHLAIETPWRDFGTAASTWIVTIDNGDDPPLNLQSVRLEMVARKLCFDAAPGASYALLYGDGSLTAPLYDYAKLFMPEPNASVATLGPEVANPQFEERPDTRPFTEKHPGLLWVVLVLVVVVLGGVAMRTAKEAPKAG
jgi:Protein of unknown function (DUF3999)